MIFILQMNVRMMQSSSHLATEMCFMAPDQELCPGGVTVGEKWSESGAVGLQLPVGHNKYTAEKTDRGASGHVFFKNTKSSFSPLPKARDGNIIIFFFFTDEANPFEITDGLDLKAA